MRQYILLSVLSLWGLGTHPAFAQNESRTKKQETIVIDDGKSTDKTVFEIRDGKIFLDGNAIKNFEPGTEIKIIKKNGNTKSGSEEEVFSMQIPDMSDRDISDSKRAFLGVGSAPTMDKEGVLVENVTPGSPAEEIRLNRGDKIKKVEGRKIQSPEELAKTIGDYKPGDKINITIEQDGKEVNKEVTLADRNTAGNGRVFRGGPFNEEFDFNFPNIEEMFRGFKGFGSTEPNIATTPRIGVQAEDRADGDGILVLEVAKGSVAEKAGIKENDVITTFAGTPIRNVDDLQNAVARNQDRKEITLDVKRGKNLQTLYMEIPKELKRKQF